jgi:ABC-type Fe3+-citrate transport system substrate-binding protein
MKKHFKSIGLVLFLIMSVVLVTACGGGGSSSSSGVCVVKSARGTAYNFCESNYDQSECNSLSDSTFYGGQTCSDLGYTLHCSGDSSNVSHVNC